MCSAHLASRIGNDPEGVRSEIGNSPGYPKEIGLSPENISYEVENISHLSDAPQPQRASEVATPVRRPIERQPLYPWLQDARRGARRGDALAHYLPSERKIQSLLAEVELAFDAQLIDGEVTSAIAECLARQAEEDDETPMTQPVVM